MGESEKTLRDIPTLSAKTLYRVVDENWVTVWSGECRNCAEMIAASNPKWMVA